MSLDKFANFYHFIQCFLEKLLTGAFVSSEVLDHFGIDNEFAYLVDFCCGSVFVVRAEHPSLMIAVLSPACTHD